MTNDRTDPRMVYGAKLFYSDGTPVLIKTYRTEVGALRACKTFLKWTKGRAFVIAYTKTSEVEVK
jgi:hypothetical protein